MPGENLSRDEARERAGLLSVDGYEVALDLRSAVGDAAAGDGPAHLPFGDDDPLPLRASRAPSTFADLLAPSVHSVTPQRPGRWTRDAVFDGARITLDGLAAENELVVDAAVRLQPYGRGPAPLRRPRGRRGLPLHAVRTGRRPPGLRQLRAARPEGPVPLRGDGARGLDGAGATARGGEPELPTRAAGCRRFATTKPISTYITAVVAGPYHYVTDTYRRTFDDGTTLEIPLGALCRKGLARHFDADDIFLVTKQGLDFFHDHFDYPYPFGKYDQAFVPGVQHRRDGEPGLVTFREEFVFRGKVTQASYERRANVILHEMAHMWFGDLVTMEWWDDLWLKESFADFMGAFSLVEATRFTRRLDHLRQPPQVLGVPRRPAALHPSGHGRHPRPGGRQAQLRRDHLRQGRVRAEAARGVRRAGTPSWRAPGATSSGTRTGNTTLGDLLAVLAETSGPRHGGVVAGLAADGRRQLPDAAGHLRRRGPDHRAGRPPGGRRRRTRSCARTGSRSASTAAPPPGTPEHGWSRYARAEADVDRAAYGRRGAGGRRAARPGPGQRRRPDVLQDPLRRGLAGHAARRTSGRRSRRPAGRAALCWSALWNLTRDGLMPARDFVDLVLALRGPRVGHRRAPDAARLGRSALTHYAAPGLARGGRTAAGRGRAERAAAGRAGQRPPAGVGAVLRAPSPRTRRICSCCSGCWRARRRSTGWTSTRSCAGRSWRPLAAQGAADEPAARRRTRPRRHRVRQAAPGALPRGTALRRGQGTGVGGRSSSPTSSPTPWSRRRSRASHSQASGS